MSRNIVLLFALIIIINSPTHSQKSAVKKQPKQGNKTTEIIAPVIVDESDKKVDEIKPYKKIAVTNYVPPKESSEAIINFFVHKAEGVKHFELDGEINDGKSEKIGIDTIFSFFKNSLQNLLLSDSSFILAFGEYELKGIFKQIHDKIIEEYKKPLNNRNQLLLSELEKEVGQLWPSKEKVEIQLELTYVRLKNETYYSDMGNAYSEPELIISQINDPLEKSYAYSAIGDFAATSLDEPNAMGLYYEAIVWLEKSNITLEQKDEEMGKLLLKIASLFYNEEEPDLLERLNFYYNTAFDYFSNSKNYEYWNKVWAYKFSSLSYLLSNFYSDSSNYSLSVNDTTSFCDNRCRERQNLNEIKFWFNKYKEHFNYEAEVNNAGFYSIARILSGKGFYEASLIYYLQALHYAIKDGSWGYIRAGIINVAHAYYLTGNSKMFNAYINLLQDLFYFSNNDWQYGNAILGISDIFFFDKKYDSCLHYLNLVQFDTLFYKNLFPPYYSRLISRVFESKYTVLDALHSDSARIYEQYYHSDKEYFHKQYESILEQEGYGKQNWTWAFQENEKNNLSIVIDSLKNEGSLLMGKIGKLNSGIALRQKQISDSSSKIKTLSKTVADLSMERNSLINNIQGLQNDTMALGIQIKSQMEENSQLSSTNNNLKTLNYFLFPLALILGGASIVSVFSLKRHRKEKIKLEQEKIIVIENLNKIIGEKEIEAEEKDLGKKLAEQQLLNDTALGHDLISLIDHVPYMLGKSIKTAPEDMRISSGLSQCLEYTKNVREYFEENFKLKEKLVNTVAGEIELAKRYCELLSIQKGRDCVANITIENLAPELLKIEIPKHNLVNFIANAFLHGRANTAKNRIDILVRGKQLSNGYVIAISDNGGGFESLNIPDKEETRGLKLVFRQIANYNSMKNSGYIIHCDESSFQNLIQDGERTGTQITYKLIRK